MAKEWDFEAEKNQNRCKTIKYSTLILCLMAIFCQSKPTITSQKSEQVNKVLYWSLFDFCLFWAAIVDFFSLFELVNDYKT